MPPRNLYSDEDILRALRRVAEEIARTPSASNQSRWGYNHFKEADEPGSAIIIGRFGSWNGALEAAGVPLSPRQPGHQRVKGGFGLRRFSDKDLLRAVEEMVARFPYLTVRVYEANAPAGFPSAALLRRRLRASVGTWHEIVAHCGGSSGPSKLR